ncbi:MAG: BrnT family toxin, partial [Candidatus Omnitrophica bacterium]|nr:BrnT family toxin [Candidatus Omnitrophota bacterium]
MSSFSWDPEREYENIRKHGIDFRSAEKAFLDPERKIFIDRQHSG